MSAHALTLIWSLDKRNMIFSGPAIANVCPTVACKQRLGSIYPRFDL